MSDFFKVFQINFHWCLDTLGSKLLLSVGWLKILKLLRRKKRITKSALTLQLCKTPKLCKWMDVCNLLSWIQAVCTGDCSQMTVIYCPKPVFCDTRGIPHPVLCVLAVCGCTGEAMAGILIPVLLSQVLTNCSWDRCTFIQGSFTCKICNFHVQLH